MSRISVDVSRDSRHWVFHVYVNGEIQPTTVFGCRDALTPLLEALLTANSEENIPGSSSETAVSVGPTLVTFHLPMGAVVSYVRIGSQNPLPNSPQLT